MKTSRQFIFCLLTASAVLSGCASAQFQITDKPDAAEKPKLQQRQPNFLSGFGSTHVINAAKVCGGADKVESVEVDQTGWDGVVAFITFGLYTPLTARVYCK
jgi:hypothetical protein